MGKFLLILTVVAGVFVAMMPIVIAAAIIGGWVFSVLWNWFIPVIFEGMPRLSIGQAMAVSLVVRFLNPMTWNPEEKDPDKKRGRLAAQILLPFLFLAVGWIIRWWFF